MKKLAFEAFTRRVESSHGELGLYCYPCYERSKKEGKILLVDFKRNDRNKQMYVYINLRIPG